MACDGHRRRYCQQMAVPGGTVAARLGGGDPARAAVVLEMVYRTARRRAAQHPEQVAGGGEETLFADMVARGGIRPEHTLGTMQDDTRRAYAELQRTLVAVRAGGDPPPLAVAIADNLRLHGGELAAVHTDWGHRRCGNCGRWTGPYALHLCPMTVTADSLSRVVADRVGVPATSYGPPMEAWETILRRVQGHPRLLIPLDHALTGAHIEVSLDYLPDAVALGYLPPAWTAHLVWIDGGGQLPTAVPQAGLALGVRRLPPPTPHSMAQVAQAYGLTFPLDSPIDDAGTAQQSPSPIPTLQGVDTTVSGQTLDRAHDLAEIPRRISREPPPSPSVSTPEEVVDQGRASTEDHYGLMQRLLTMSRDELRNLAAAPQLDWSVLSELLRNYDPLVRVIAANNAELRSESSLDERTLLRDVLTYNEEVLFRGIHLCPDCGRFMNARLGCVNCPHRWEPPPLATLYLRECATFPTLGVHCLLAPDAVFDRAAAESILQQELGTSLMDRYWRDAATPDPTGERGQIRVGGNDSQSDPATPPTPTLDGSSDPLPTQRERLLPLLQALSPWGDEDSRDAEALRLLAATPLGAASPLWAFHPEDPSEPGGVVESIERGLLLEVGGMDGLWNIGQHGNLRERAALATAPFRSPVVARALLSDLSIAVQLLVANNPDSGIEQLDDARLQGLVRQLSPQGNSPITMCPLCGRFQSRTAPCLNCPGTWEGDHVPPLTRLLINQRLLSVERNVPFELLWGLCSSAQADAWVEDLTTQAPLRLGLDRCVLDDHWHDIGLRPLLRSLLRLVETAPTPSPSVAGDGEGTRTLMDTALPPHQPDTATLLRSLGPDGAGSEGGNYGFAEISGLLQEHPLGQSSPLWETHPRWNVGSRPLIEHIRLLLTNPPDPVLMGLIQQISRNETIRGRMIIATAPFRDEPLANVLLADDSPEVQLLVANNPDSGIGSAPQSPWRNPTTAGGAWARLPIHPCPLCGRFQSRTAPCLNCPGTWEGDHVPPLTRLLITTTLLTEGDPLAADLLVGLLRSAQVDAFADELTTHPLLRQALGRYLNNHSQESRLRAELRDRIYNWLDHPISPSPPPAMELPAGGDNGAFPRVAPPPPATSAVAGTGVAEVAGPRSLLLRITPRGTPDWQVVRPPLRVSTGNPAETGARDDVAYSEVLVRAGQYFARSIGRQGGMEWVETQPGRWEGYQTYPDGSNGLMTTYDRGTGLVTDIRGQDAISAEQVATVLAACAADPHNLGEEGWAEVVTQNLVGSPPPTTTAFMEVAQTVWAGLGVASQEPVLRFGARWEPLTCPHCGRFSGTHHRCPIQPGEVVPLVEMTSSGHYLFMHPPFVFTPTPSAGDDVRMIYDGVGENQGFTPRAPWTVPDWWCPLSRSQGEVDSFNDLNARFRARGRDALTPTEFERLYQYQARRWTHQTRRVSEVLYGSEISSPDAMRNLGALLAESERRFLGLRTLQAARGDSAPPPAYPPNPVLIMQRASALLETSLLTNAPLFVSPTLPLEQHGLRDLPTAVPIALPITGLPLDQATTPLWIRLPPGDSTAQADFARLIVTSPYPIHLLQADSVLSEGALVINWGDPLWTSPLATPLNSQPAILRAGNRISTLHDLGNLAPATTGSASQAVRQLGATFVATRSDAGIDGPSLIIVNPPTDPQRANLPLGAVPPSRLAMGGDLYQEFLPTATHYRAVMLGRRVVAIYARDGDTQADDRRLPTIAPAALEVARTAMTTMALDVGEVGLLYDNQTGRWLTHGVSSAPCLTAGTLEALYTSLILQVQRRCEVCGQFQGGDSHYCPGTADPSHVPPWLTPPIVSAVTLGAVSGRSIAPPQASSPQSDPQPLGGVSRRAAAPRSRPNPRAGVVVPSATLPPQQVSSSVMPPQQVSSSVMPPHESLEGGRGADTLARWRTELTTVRAEGGSYPLAHEGALGECATGFGVEIEFTTATGNEVARRLYALGLCAHDYMVPYKHSCSSCTGPAHDSQWKVERDGSVTVYDGGIERGGELVSPVLSDRPEDWQQLVTVTALVRELGGRVDSTTGQHVHLSTADFGGSAELYTSLIRTAAEYEDLLYRLGAPDVSHHRGILNPNRSEPYYYARSILSAVQQCFRESLHPTLAQIKTAFRTGEQDSYHSEGHYFGLNLEHVVEVGVVLRADRRNSSRIELRTPNGTLDAAQIQTNVRLAAALVSAARNAVTNGEVTNDPLVAHSVGWHADQGLDQGDTTQLLQLLDQSSLPDEACRSLLDTFQRSHWQPAMRPNEQAVIRARRSYSTLC